MYTILVTTSTQARPCDRAVHSQSSLFVLLLSGSLAAAFLFFSLSSMGLKWAKVRMKPLKFTWSSLKTREGEKKDLVQYVAAQITFILHINTIRAGNTMKTSRNLTPFYKVKHFSSSQVVLTQTTQTQCNKNTSINYYEQQLKLNRLHIGLFGILMIHLKTSGFQLSDW